MVQHIGGELLDGVVDAAGEVLHHAHRQPQTHVHHRVHDVVHHALHLHRRPASDRPNRVWSLMHCSLTTMQARRFSICLAARYHRTWSASRQGERHAALDRRVISWDPCAQHSWDSKHLAQPRSCCTGFQSSCSVWRTTHAWICRGRPADLRIGTCHEERQQDQHQAGHRRHS